jgi:type I restriction-modification system DNA methylase subunit
MDQATHSKIVSFLWGIADDVLRDLFKRGKYPDVILPMGVLRRLDAVLEPTKQGVLDTRQMLDAAGITEQRAALCDAAGQAFYNTSNSPYAILGRAAASSSSASISTLIATIFPRMSKTSWTISSSETRSRRYSRPTRSAP